MAIQNIELEEQLQNSEVDVPLVEKSVNIVKNVKVKLDVVVGDAVMSVGELYELHKGSVIKLEQDANSPVEVKLDGSVIARGMLSVVDDNFAVRITEISKLT